MENFGKLGENAQGVEIVGWAYVMPLYPDDAEFEIDLTGNHGDITSENGFADRLMGELFNGGTHCNCCNRVIKYVAVGLNEATQTYHAIGRNCAEIFQYSPSVKKNLDKMEKKTLLAKKRVLNAKKVQAIYDKHEGLEEALKTDNNIVQDIRSRVIQYHNISDKQVALVMKIAKQDAEFKAQREAELADASPIDFKTIADKVLTIVSIKPKEGFYGTQNKVLLKAEEGWKLYGNIPMNTEFKAGDSILFSCNTITKSDKDEYFGFFKRGRFDAVPS